MGLVLDKLISTLKLLRNCILWRENGRFCYIHATCYGNDYVTSGLLILIHRVY